MNEDGPVDEKLSERVVQLEERIKELGREASASEQKHQDASRRLRMEKLLSEMGVALLDLSADRVDEGIANWLGRIGELVELDRVALFNHLSEEQRFQVTQSWERAGVPPVRTSVRYDEMPWIYSEILSGHIVRIEQLEELPAAATTDVASLKKDGDISVVVIPLRVRGALIGAAAFGAFRQNRGWSDELVEWLNVAAQMFANVLTWLGSQSELEATRSLLLAAIEQSPAGILIADAPDVRIRLANSAALGIRGDSDKPLTEIPVEEHPSHWQTFREDGTMFEPEALPLSRAILEGKKSQNVVARIRRADGEDRWVLANAAPVRDAAGNVVAGVVVFPDVTDSIKAHEALQAGEEKFKQAFRSSPDSITISRLSDGCYLDVNEGFERLTGYKRDDVIGKSSVELELWADPIDRDRMKEALERDGQVTDMEIRFTDKAGQSRDCLLSAGVIQLDGEPCLVATVRDISEQKKAIEELESSMRVKAGIVESIPSGLFSYKYEPPDRLILLDGNPAAEKLTGIPVSEWIGREFNEIWPEAKKRGITEAFLSVMWTGKTLETEDTYYQDDRLEGVFKIAAFPMSESMLGVAFENITERKQAEQALRESQDRYQRLAEATHEGIGVTDRGIVLDVNQQLAEMLGYSREEMLGMNVADMVAPESRKTVQKHLAARRDDAYEHLALHKDGTVIPVEVRSKTIPLEGRTVRVAAIRDLTEQKKAQAELNEAAAELEKKHQDLSEKHAALKQVLEHMEQEKTEYRHELSSNVEHALEPFVEKLRRSGGSLTEADIDLLHDTIKSLTASDMDVFAKNYDKLSPRERDICDRIRDGLSSKEIADDLHVTSQTVEKHRASIRKKLQLKHKKVNLASYLRSR